MFLRIRSAVLLELILPALATSPVEEDVGSTRGWGWGSASRLLITRRVGDGSSYKLHDSKPRPSRPTSRRQQLLYRREEKPSQGQMASDATFQAGAVGAGPVCTRKVCMCLTDLRTSVAPFQASRLSQRFAWVFFGLSRQVFSSGPAVHSACPAGEYRDTETSRTPTSPTTR